MSQQYCSATSADAEDFANRSSTWWESALEFFYDDEDAHEDRAMDIAMDRCGEAAAVNREDRRAVTCGVGRCRAPVSPSAMFRGADDARRLLADWSENQDDYQLECADYPNFTDEQMRDLAQELKCTIQEWEARHKAAPTWFIVESSIDISYGLALDCNALSVEIDKHLKRYEHDQSRWWPPAAMLPVSDDGSAIEVKTLDLWQAASLLGIPAPEKPKRLP